MNVYVGIDVGAKGGIFAIKGEREVLLKEAIPTVKGSSDVDYIKLWTFLKRIRKKTGHQEKMIVILEHVHSLYGMSAKSNFSFGHIKGVKEGMLTALGVDYYLIPPKQWQKAVWVEDDVVIDSSGKRDKKDTKATSLNAAKRIYPDIDFRKSSRAKIPHDGIVDAALMAEYAKIIDE